MCIRFGLILPPPGTVLVEAVDEVNRRLKPLGGREDQHRVRLVVGDGVDVVGQVALLTQVVTGTHHELTHRVVEFVSTLCVEVHTVSVVEQRGLHLNGR